MMDDEIESVAELIERAQLHEVVILRVAADRRGSRSMRTDSLPEELHAPDSVEESAAVNLATRLSATTLVVTLEAHACNAYADFQVDAQAVFVLPAPVALGKEAIVHDFTEKIGAITVFPYIRAAVASLAGQLSVPASPLPLLHSGGMELHSEGEPSGPPVPDGVLAQGTYSRIAEDGTTEQLGDFFIDAETGNLLRFGAEGEHADIEEMLKILAEEAAGGPWVPIAAADDEALQQLIRDRGLQEVRSVAESMRGDEGDEAADAMLARIETADWNIRLEEAVLALNAAMNDLDKAVSVTAADGDDAVLRDAAADVFARWAEYRDL